MHKKQFGFAHIGILLILLIIAAVAGGGWWVWHSQKVKNNINSYEDCVKAGGKINKKYPIYPEFCAINDNQYTDENDKVTNFAQCKTHGGKITVHKPGADECWLAGEGPSFSGPDTAVVTCTENGTLTIKEWNIKILSPSPLGICYKPQSAVKGVIYYLDMTSEALAAKSGCDDSGGGIISRDKPNNVISLPDDSKITVRKYNKDSPWSSEQGGYIYWWQQDQFSCAYTKASQTKPDPTIKKLQNDTYDAMRELLKNFTIIKD